MKWYYMNEHEAVGPVRIERLQELAHAGAIFEDTPVRSDETDEWHDANEVPGLFPEPSDEESAVQMCPRCGERINIDWKHCPKCGAINQQADWPPIRRSPSHHFRRERPPFSQRLTKRIILLFAVVAGITCAIVIATAFLLRDGEGSLVGSAFVEFTDGSSQPLRGQEIFLLPEKIQKSQVDEIYTKWPEFFGQDGTMRIDKFYERLSITRQTTTDEPQSRFLSAVIPSLVMAKYVSRIAVVTVETDVDGKYHIGRVPAGNYYVWSLYDRKPDGGRLHSIEWFLSIRIRAGDDVSLNLSSNNAISIYNQE